MRACRLQLEAVLPVKGSALPRLTRPKPCRGLGGGSRGTPSYCAVALGAMPCNLHLLR